MEELDINRLKLLLLAFLVITIGSCIGSAADFHVQRGGSIQAAINNASSGDTIFVASGTYVENIDISKMGSLDNLVLRSESGNPTDTVITANLAAPTTVKGVISISKFKTNVTVTGFTINNARNGPITQGGMAGVYLENSNQCKIENNIFTNDGFGVYVNGGTAGGNVISNNIVNRTRAVQPYTTYEGIYVTGSGNTVISQNTVSNNNNGIHISGSAKGSSISGNTVNNNAQFGIFLDKVKGVTVDGNTLSLNNLIGINLAGSGENYVTNNKVTMPGLYASTNDFTQGIQLIVSSDSVGSDSNIVSNNVVTNSQHSIFVNGCTNNTIQNNRAYDNNYGIAMRYSQKNRVINNNVDGNTNGNNSEGIFLTYSDTGNIVSGNSASGCNRGIELSVNCGPNNIVDNNTVNLNQFYGIYVEAPSNKISNNSLSQNVRGIFLTGLTCHDNTVSNNVVKESSGNGISLVNTSINNKIVSNNLISNANQKGIEVYLSNNSYIDSNFAQDNDMGIQLENSNGVTVNNNTAYQNRIGIRLYYSSNNNVTMNNVSYGTGSDSGIDFNSATDNIVAGNLITFNGKGISMCPACHNNRVYNNYFNNDPNTDIQGTGNTWNIARTKGKNVVGGPYIGGNYWASPGGDGFSQTAQDMNGDGISDAPYIFTNSYQITINDNLPLVSVILPVADFSFTPTQGVAPLTVQFTDNSQNTDSRIWNFGDGTSSNETSPSHIYSAAGTYTVTLTASNKNSSVPKSATITVQEYKALPVADFDANPTTGYAALTVQFTDKSQNADSRIWNFGDGTTSAELNPSHIYSTEGTYTATLTVNNANGTNSKPVTITVQSSGGGGGSSHSSSSGGGGGAGGSPEPQNNVEIKELSQAFITSGSAVKFDFPQKVTPVVTVNFDSKKTVGKTTTIVEMLKAKSTLTSGAPADEVYKYINIWVGSGGYATEKNIENPAVSFKVPKSWVQDKKIDKSTITLNRYSDKTWNQLPTSLSGEDDTYLYFTAKTPGFSPFAVTGKSTSSAVQPSVDKAQSPTVSATQNNTGAGSTAASTQKTPGQKESPSPSPKQSTSLPGFETVFAIAGLLAVFLYRRK